MLAAGGGAAANLDLVPTFANRVSGGADAAQSTASNQPIAHTPVGGGHLHLPAVTGNYASLAAGVNLGTQTEILIGVKVRTWRPSIDQSLFDQYPASIMVWQRTTGKFQVYYGTSANFQTSSVIPTDAPLETVIKIVRDGTDASTEVFYKDHDGSFTSLGSTTLGAVGAAPTGSGQELSIGRWRSGNQKYADCSYQTLKVTADSTVTLDLDMADGDHKASSFTCASGQTVTVNKGSTTRDAATIVRRPFLRFDGADNFMSGLFNQTLSSGGYMFAAFSVNYGSETYARVFAVNSTDPDEPDYNNPRSLAFSLRQTTTDDVGWYYNNAFRDGHTGTYDKDRGAVLHELKAIDGEQVSKVNNADAKTKSLDLSGLSSEKFTIGGRYDGNGNASLDLEALYLFDHTLTDDEATQVRDYLNAKSSIY
tara:strand:+ start:3374 stop:4642 length:1269 start_codon:yes stop_codon:yes gene_type:complete